MLLLRCCDGAAAWTFFICALCFGLVLVEVIIDCVLIYLCVFDEMVLGVWYVIEQYMNNFIEVDYGWLKARL